jgi:hypothetical protein
MYHPLLLSLELPLFSSRLLPTWLCPLLVTTALLVTVLIAVF